jgi:hypothetical protein
MARLSAHGVLRQMVLLSARPNKGVNLTLGRYTHPKAQPAQVTPNTLDAQREVGRGDHPADWLLDIR